MERSNPAGTPTMPSGERRHRKGRVLIGVALMLALAAGFAVALLVTDDGSDGGAGPTEAAVLVEDGLQLHVDGDLAGAADRYRSAIAIDADSVLAHYNLGLVHQLEDRADEARREYERTIELDAGYAPALFNLGVLTAATGDTDGAIDLYRRAVASDPGLAGAQFNLGLLLLETGDVEGGNAAIQTAIEIDPSLADRLEQSPA